MIDDILALPRFNLFNPNSCYKPVEIATIHLSKIKMFYVGGVAKENLLLVSEDLHLKNDSVHMYNVEPLDLESVVQYKPLMELKPKKESERFKYITAYGKPECCKNTYHYLSALEDQKIVATPQIYDIEEFSEIPAIQKWNENYGNTSIVSAEILKSYEFSKIFRKLLARYKANEMVFNLE